MIRFSHHPSDAKFSKYLLSYRESNTEQYNVLELSLSLVQDLVLHLFYPDVQKSLQIFYSIYE